MVLTRQPLGPCCADFRHQKRGARSWPATVWNVYGPAGLHGQAVLHPFVRQYFQSHGCLGVELGMASIKEVTVVAVAGVADVARGQRWRVVENWSAT